MAQWMTIGIKVGLAGEKKKVTAKESSFMLNWLFSKSPETVVNQLREKDKIQESCTVQLSIKSVVQGFFSWYLANKISTGDTGKAFSNLSRSVFLY